MNDFIQSLSVVGIVLSALATGCGSSGDAGAGGDASGGHASSSTVSGGHASGSGGGDVGGASAGGGGSGGGGDSSGWIDKGSGVPDSPVKKGNALACTLTVGSGSGQIQINPTTPAALHPGDVVCIAPGTYDGMSVADLDASSGAPITIQNGGAVTFTGVVGLARLQNVVVSGAGGNPGSMNDGGITMSTYQDAFDVSGKTDHLAELVRGHVGCAGQRRLSDALSFL